MWLVFALLSAFAASLTAVLVKISLSGMEANTATFIRTLVAAVFSLSIVIFSKSHAAPFSLKSLVFLILSGFSTTISWLFYHRSLKIGELSKVSAVDKMSVVITLLFSFLLLHEKITLHKALGIVFITAGTLFMAF